MVWASVWDQDRPVWIFESLWNFLIKKSFPCQPCQPPASKNGLALHMTCESLQWFIEQVWVTWRGMVDFLIRESHWKFKLSPASHGSNKKSFQGETGVSLPHAGHPCLVTASGCDMSLPWVLHVPLWFYNCHFAFFDQKKKERKKINTCSPWDLVRPMLQPLLKPAMSFWTSLRHRGFFKTRSQPQSQPLS